MTVEVAYKAIWEPQPGPQTALIACPIQEIFYGGARGGGKTEGSIGDWLQHSSQYGEDAVGVFFRRKFKQLEEVVARTKQIFPLIGGKFNEQKAEWTMPNRARLKFRYLERDSDAEEYQGHSYTRVYVEELTNFPSPAPIDKLRATLRSAKGVPTGMRLTGNPGGPGHNWVKARYITPAPAGWVPMVETFPGPEGTKLQMERVFIPSKISDNALLWKNDPYYVARLHQSGSAALVKAWLEGNWDLIDGSFFDTWDETIHVLPASDWRSRIPKHWVKFRSLDWGFAKPFSVGWWAVSDGTIDGLPREALVRYREWYGCDGRPNQGVRMDAGLVAKGILARERIDEERGFNVEYGVADPSIFVRDGGPCIAELMSVEGCLWQRADNKRVPGWTEMRRRLGNALREDGSRTPAGLYVFDTCKDFIRTVPTLQHDETDAEDLDTEGEDHVADEVRYACMSRPWVEDLPQEPVLTFPKTPAQLTINELIEQNARNRRMRDAEAALG